MTTTATRPEKYIARAYDAGLGDFKRYIVEASDEADARRILAGSGLGDAHVEPYRAFYRRRRRRTQLIVGSIVMLIAVGVGLLVWQPWRPDPRSKRTGGASSAARRDAKPADASGAGKSGAPGSAGSLAPTFDELRDRYNLDDGRLYLPPTPEPK